MTTYTTTKVNFVELEKKLNRIFKKLDKIGGNYEFKVIREFVKEVPVYTIDDVTQTKYRVDTARVECVEYTMTFDPYKVGDYRMGAFLEAAEDGTNLVYTVDENFPFKDYDNTNIRCDHCGTNHRRTRAMVLVDNNTGSHKMVGMACLKDFVGYNAEQFAKYFHEIEEITMTYTMDIRDTELHKYSQCVDERDYLARCIRKIKEHGYTKEVKTEAMLDIKKNDITDEYFEEADKVIKFFESYDPQDAFENNIKVYVTGRKPITFENGFVAYAYVQMTKIIKSQQDEMERQMAKAASNYVGTIGQKITVEGTISTIASYETMYGYTYIYKIVDKNKNVFIWKTCKFIDTTEINEVKVTGTIKDHSEYREEKQTVLTRCKVA